VKRGEGGAAKAEVMRDEGEGGEGGGEWGAKVKGAKAEVNGA